MATEAEAEVVGCGNRKREDLGAEFESEEKKMEAEALMKAIKKLDPWK